MSASINYRSGNLDVSMLRSVDGFSYDFKTVQSLDFAIDDAIEVMDSLNQQRLGYFLAPRRIRINMGVLPAEYDGEAKNDASILSEQISYFASNNDELDYTLGFFDLTVTDDNQGVIYEFKDCMVLEGSPGNIIIDQRPASQWSILALDCIMTNKSSELDTAAGDGSIINS